MNKKLKNIKKEKYTPPGFGWDRIGAHYGYRRMRAMGKFEYWYPSITYAFKAALFHGRQSEKHSNDPVLEDFHKNISLGADSFIKRREVEDAGTSKLIQKLYLKEIIKNCEKMVKDSIKEYGKAHPKTKRARQKLKNFIIDLRGSQ